MYQLRTYTLRTTDALEDYATVHWAPPHQQPPSIWSHHPRHLTQHDPDVHRLVALISYPDGADPAKVTTAYMASPEFARDMDGFDVSNILNVEELLLDPTAASPLV